MTPTIRKQARQINISGFLSFVLVLGALLLLSVNNLWAATSQCFSQAETYYEQVFCEVKSKGKGQSLPNYADFKRNNDITQALLLKREAAKIGIKIKMPKRSNTKSVARAATPPKTHSKIAAAPIKASRSISEVDGHVRPHCKFLGNAISCKGARFLPVGNKRNPKLAKTALTSNNSLGISTFRGSLSNQEAVDTYLYKSYSLYLNKMLEIGLGGVTMSYSKFAYLFYDLHEKGVSFSQRFETMFTYLKKDKLTMAVSEATPSVSGLTLDDCSRVTDVLFACEQRTRNYLFLKTL